MSGGGGSSGPQKTTVINRNPAQEAFLPANREASKQLLALLKRTDSFKGDLAAPIQQGQTSALDRLEERLRSYQPASTKLNESLLRNAQDTADGKYLNPETNPYAQGASRVISKDLQRQFQDDIIPQFQSQAIASGAYGGAAYGRDSERLGRQHADSVSDALYRNFNGLYGAERTNQLNAGPQFQNAVAQGSLLDSLRGEIGGQKQQIEQNYLNQLYTQYQARNTPSPAVLASLGQQSPGLGQSTTTSPGGRSAGGLGNIAGGLAAFKAGQTLFPTVFAGAAGQTAAVAAGAGLGGAGAAVGAGTGYVAGGGAATAAAGGSIAGPVGIAAALGAYYLGSKFL